MELDKEKVFVSFDEVSETNVKKIIKDKRYKELISSIDKLSDISWIELKTNNSFRNEILKNHKLQEKVKDETQIYSIRITGKIRVYYYRVGNVLKIIKVDLNHEDT